MREYVLTINGTEFRTEVRELSPDAARVAVNGVEYRIELKNLGLKKDLAPRAQAAELPQATRTTEPPRAAAKPASQAAGGAVPSPLPGLVLDLAVRVGDQVKAGQKLLVLETMKMENQVAAPFDGIVKSVLVQKGDTVTEGQILIEVSRPNMTTL